MLHLLFFKHSSKFSEHKTNYEMLLSVLSRQLSHILLLLRKRTTRKQSVWYQWLQRWQGRWWKCGTRDQIKRELNIKWKVQGNKVLMAANDAVEFQLELRQIQVSKSSRDLNNNQQTWHFTSTRLHLKAALFSNKQPSIYPPTHSPSNQPSIQPLIHPYVLVSFSSSLLVVDFDVQQQSSYYFLSVRSLWQ